MKHNYLKICRFVLNLLLGLLSLNTAFAQKNKEKIDNPLIDLIEQNAISIDNLSEKKLADTFKNIKVIGLGESTHGTSEFIRSKKKIIEYLVTHEGLTGIILETPFTTTIKLNQYITNGKGNPREIVSDLGYIMWSTEEFIELIDWLRQYNLKADTKHKVSVYGMDFFSNLSHGISEVISYFSEHGNDFSEPQKNKIQELEAIELNYWPFKIAEKQDEMKQVLSELIILESSLEFEKDNYVAKSSEDKYWEIQMFIEIMKEWITSNLAGTYTDTPNEIRSKKMALNAIRIMENDNPNAKFVVWAHNFHISRDTTFRNLGQVLAKKYQDSYFSIGFEFGEGSYLCRKANPDYSLGELMSAKVAPSNDKYFSWYLSETKHNSFFFNFRDIQSNDNNPLNTNFLIHYHDWLGQDSSPREINPIKAFDGLVFVKKSNPSKPTEQGSKKAKQGWGY